MSSCCTGITGRATSHGVRVIAVNTAYQLAPWADLCYFCDQCWYIWHHGGLDVTGHRRPGPFTPVRYPGFREFREFNGIKAALENACTYAVDPSVRILHNYGEKGFCDVADGVTSGRSSGYQAIHLAAHLGVVRVLLLGFDMRAVDGRTHWHSGTPLAHQRATAPQDFDNEMLPRFADLVDPLAKRGIGVLNCTPGSAIQCFPRADLADALRATSHEPGAT